MSRPRPHLSQIRRVEECQFLALDVQGRSEGSSRNDPRAGRRIVVPLDESTLVRGKGDGAITQELKLFVVNPAWPVMLASVAIRDQTDRFAIRIFGTREVSS